MMRGLIYVVQVLVWLLFLRLLLRTVAAFLAGLRGPATAAPRARPQVRAPEDLVHDRVCHSHGPRSRAIRATVAGRDEWFCSEACRERALAAVARAS